MHYSNLSSNNMARILAISLLFLITAGLTASGHSRTLFGQKNVLSARLQAGQDDPYQTLRVHNVANIALTVTNMGQIGTGFLSIPAIDPFTGQPAPSCEYPLPNGQKYLFAGALWVGAVVGEDTLVSVGADGWNFTREMWPDKYPGGDILYRGEDSAGVVSDQDFIAVFTDTLTDPAFVNEDPYDGRPHLPLGLKITQKSYAWNTLIAEDFVIFDYRVENIGDRTLNQVYLGFYVDGDVQHGPNTGFDDDISGFTAATGSLQDCDFPDPINIAWIADNDGLDPNAACPYGPDAVTAVTGISLIRTPSDSLDVSFNWWVSNNDPQLDWGPSTTLNYPTCGDTCDGTPLGDKGKYRLLSNREIDYDQLTTAVDHTGEGWMPAPTHALNIADGYDARYLLSFGPFDISPGQVLPFTIAYVAGEDFHTECNAFDSLYNPAMPQAYIDYLSTDDIAVNAMWASWYYDNPGIDTDGDGYYGDFIMCGTDTIYYRGDGFPDMTPYYICGDCDGDTKLDLVDIVWLIDYVYRGGTAPVSGDYADVNNDGLMNILDITRLIDYLYKDGLQPLCR